MSPLVCRDQHLNVSTAETGICSNCKFGLFTEVIGFVASENASGVQPPTVGKIECGAGNK
ncbi:hypothetical protein GGD50_004507 [Rhizobium paranaense]|uniref:Uncharacterized protein n=1 Tax=Rhizobium paranaense TaxID=1650438 RepID=A0A7W8XUL8_9HYPH|nr:hypothetical protein [Rhizobium paranaense]